MQINSLHVIVFRSLAVLALMLVVPSLALAYGYGYGEGAYYGYGYGYGQSTYYGYGYGYGYGQATYATEIRGNVQELHGFVVTGNISKPGGSFVIDHPLDPKNKLLFHSFVESPDVKNFYDGIISLDQGGEAIVQLPNYFDALNKEVRYQLKPIGAAMPNLFVKSEEKNNQFTIGGGVPGGRVSWQVTGTRHDPFMVAYPIVTEVEKGPGQLVGKGEYLHPEVYLSSAFSFALPSQWDPNNQNAQ